MGHLENPAVAFAVRGRQRLATCRRFTRATRGAPDRRRLVLLCRRRGTHARRRGRPAAPSEHVSAMGHSSGEAARSRWMKRTSPDRGHGPGCGSTAGGSGRRRVQLLRTVCRARTHLPTLELTHTTGRAAVADRTRRPRRAVEGGFDRKRDHARSRAGPMPGASASTVTEARQVGQDVERHAAGRPAPPQRTRRQAMTAARCAGQRMRDHLVVLSAPPGGRRGVGQRRQSHNREPW